MEADLVSKIKSFFEERSSVSLCGKSIQASRRSVFVVLMSGVVASAPVAVSNYWFGNGGYASPLASASEDAQTGFDMSRIIQARFSVKSYDGVSIAQRNWVSGTEFGLEPEISKSTPGALIALVDPGADLEKHINNSRLMNVIERSSGGLIVKKMDRQFIADARSQLVMGEPGDYLAQFGDGVQDVLKPDVVAEIFVLEEPQLFNKRVDVSGFLSKFSAPPVDYNDPGAYVDEPIKLGGVFIRPEQRRVLAVARKIGAEIGLEKTLEAIVYAETLAGHTKRVNQYNTAFGIMQMKPMTVRFLMTKYDGIPDFKSDKEIKKRLMNDDVFAIEMAALYLDYNLKKNKTWRRAVVGYYTGHNGVSRMSDADVNAHFYLGKVKSNLSLLKKLASDKKRIAREDGVDNIKVVNPVREITSKHERASRENTLG